jgi:4'-phosphopantetheinyl transferase
MVGAGEPKIGLASDQFVEFYRVDLNPSPEAVQVCRQVLSPEERARADRYVTGELTRRSVVCRGVLRQLLGKVLSLPPAEIRFRIGPHGKPALAAERGSNIEFNVSHTADLAVIALAGRRSVGVDVESVDRKVNRDELAARFFSIAECRAYFSLPEPQRTAAFYRIWTCKEAYLKAIGAGLSFPLGKFSVSVAPDEPPGLVDVEQQPQEVERWSFVVLPVGPEYAAALAVEGHGWTLREWIWDHRTGTGISCDRK